MTRNLSWIVLPTLNEAENIVGMLDGIGRAMPAGDYLICVVDDGSRDGTVERVRAFMREHEDVHVELLQRQKTHRGSQRGIAVMDADLSHRPEELGTGLRLLREEGYNVAIASKYSAGSRVVNRPWGRRALSFVANTAVRTLITPAIRDYSNGYRFYDRRSVEVICGRPLRYGSPIYLTEVLSLLLAHHVRVGEFGATDVGRGEGLSKLRMIDLVKAAMAVVDIAARFHLQGRPDPEHVAPGRNRPGRDASAETRAGT
jgi:dolichol-phosphate mannosyltransferase